jgi:hypothetical protein
MRRRPSPGFSRSPRLPHCLHGRRKILELGGPDLMDNDSYRYIDNDSDKEKKGGSFTPQLFLRTFYLIALHL